MSAWKKEICLADGCVHAGKLQPSETFRPLEKGSTDRVCSSCRLRLAKQRKQAQLSAEVSISTADKENESPGKEICLADGCVHAGKLQLRSSFRHIQKGSTDRVCSSCHFRLGQLHLANMRQRRQALYSADKENESPGTLAPNRSFLGQLIANSPAAGKSRLMKRCFHLLSFRIPISCLDEFFST